MRDPIQTTETAATTPTFTSSSRLRIPPGQRKKLTSNTPPTATILAPSGGSSFASTDAISFKGTAADTEDGDLTGRMTWNSNIDGAIGTGGSFLKTLKAGNHTITASATDTGDLTTNESVDITVTSPPPTEPAPEPDPAPAPEPSTDSGFYGCPWRSESLGNLEVGRYEGRMVGIRFRAERTGRIDAVRLYLMHNIHSSGKTGYSAGDGGIVHCEFMTDDGTPEHLPSGTVLAEFTYANPIQTLTSSGSYFGELVFDHPVNVTAGEIYHLLFSNPHSDPVNNYYSLDFLHNSPWNEPQMVPHLPDSDLAVLLKTSSSSSLQQWSNKTPIYTLCYEDGTYQGQPYINHRLSVTRNIQGNAMVRTRFTVSGGDKVVEGVHVAVKKYGNPSGNLSIRLEDGSGREIETIAVPPSQVSTENNWVGDLFANTHTLMNGQEYRLVLSAPADSSNYYRAYPCTDGISYGMQGLAFRDGLWEYTTGSGWSQEGSNDDMQFYFVCQ